MTLKPSCPNDVTRFVPSSMAELDDIDFTDTGDIEQTLNAST